MIAANWIGRLPEIEAERARHPEKSDSAQKAPAPLLNGRRQEIRIPYADR